MCSPYIHISVKHSCSFVCFLARYHPRTSQNVRILSAAKCIHNAAVECLLLLLSRSFVIADSFVKSTAWSFGVNLWMFSQSDFFSKRFMSSNIKIHHKLLLENDSLRTFLSEFCIDKNVLMLGDFNLPSIKWDETRTDSVLPSRATPFVRSLYEIIFKIVVGRRSIRNNDESVPF